MSDLFPIPEIHHVSLDRLRAEYDAALFAYNEARSENDKTATDRLARTVFDTRAALEKAERESLKATRHD